MRRALMRFGSCLALPLAFWAKGNLPSDPTNLPDVDLHERLTIKTAAITEREFEDDGDKVEILFLTIRSGNFGCWVNATRPVASPAISWWSDS